MTAYARRNLFTAILECGTDYIYADTDSVKIFNYEKHREYFENYNAWIIDRLKRTCDYYGFSYDMIAPKTIKGIKKPLGVWDRESPDGGYPVFKTLGAKRYMYLDGGELHITLAGSNKKKTADYLISKYGKYYAFYKFDNYMTVPVEYSGRTSSYYIDNETSGTVIDYLGNAGTFHELTSVHVEQTAYNLSISQNYIDYFLEVQNEK